MVENLTGEPDEPEEINTEDTVDPEELKKHPGYASFIDYGVGHFGLNHPDTHHPDDWVDDCRQWMVAFECGRLAEVREQLINAQARKEG